MITAVRASLLAVQGPTSNPSNYYHGVNAVVSLNVYTLIHLGMTGSVPRSMCQCNNQATEVEPAGLSLLGPARSSQSLSLSSNQAKASEEPSSVRFSPQQGDKSSKNRIYDTTGTSWPVVHGDTAAAYILNKYQAKPLSVVLKSQGACDLCIARHACSA